MSRRRHLYTYRVEDPAHYHPIGQSVNTLWLMGAVRSQMMPVYIISKDGADMQWAPTREDARSLCDRFNNKEGSPPQ